MGEILLWFSLLSSGKERPYPFLQTTRKAGRGVYVETDKTVMAGFINCTGFWLCVTTDLNAFCAVCRAACLGSAGVNHVPHVAAMAAACQGACPSGCPCPTDCGWYNRLASSAHGVLLISGPDDLEKSMGHAAFVISSHERERESIAKGSPAN